MREDQRWGPSMMLSYFMEKLPELVDKIAQNKNEIMGRYYEFENYGVV